MLWIGCTLLGLGLGADLFNVVLSYRYGILGKGGSPIIGLPLLAYFAAALVFGGLGTGYGWLVAAAGTMVHFMAWVPLALIARKRRGL